MAKKVEIRAEENGRQNNIGILGFFLVLFSLGVFSFLLGDFLGLRTVSLILSRTGYILAAGCGVLSFVKDAKDMKKGMKTSENAPCATVALFLSLYLLLCGLAG